MGAACTMLLAPFAVNGYKLTAARQAEGAALAKAEDNNPSTTSAAESADQQLAMQSDIQSMMGDATLKNRSGHEYEVTDGSMKIAHEPIERKIDSLPQESPEPSWIPTPTPSPTPAPTPTPTPVPEFVWIDGLKPMTQREYSAYQNIQGWNYIGSAAAGGSWGYTGGMCTWYVYNARVNAGLGLSNSLGAASQWAYTAQAQGYWVDHTPTVGAAAVSPSQNHVMFVEKVFADGSIQISEGGWNYSAYVYNRRVISAGTASYFFYIH